MRTNLQRLEGCDVPSLPCGLHSCHMLWICVELTCRQVKAPSACSMQHAACSSLCDRKHFCTYQTLPRSPINICKKSLPFQSKKVWLPTVMGYSRHVQR